MVLLDYARLAEQGLVWSGRGDHQIPGESEVQSVVIGGERGAPAGTALLCNSETPSKQIVS